MSLAMKRDFHNYLIITFILFRYWCYLIETQMMLKIPTNQKVFFHVLMWMLKRKQMLA